MVVWASGPGKDRGLAGLAQVRVPMRLSASVLALATVLASGCGAGDSTTGDGASDPDSAPTAAYAPVARLCEVVDAAVFEAMATRSLLPLDTGEGKDTCVIETCCRASSDIRPNGAVQAGVVVADDPDQARSAFELEPEEREPDGRSLPEDVADSWDESWFTSRESGSGNTAMATVRVRLLDSNLLLDLIFGVSGPSANADGQQAVLLELADELRTAAARP